MVQTDVKITAASNRTIEQFQDLIQKRIQWCNETKEDAVAAIAITALRSIRASTRVASDTKPPEILLEYTSLVPSWERVGGHNKPCLRNYGGVKYTCSSNERILIEDLPRKDMLVYKYVDEHKKDKPITYYIVASTYERAEWAMQRKLLKRIRAWRGLARKALSVLMQKTCTINDGDQANAKVTQTANNLTKKSDLKGGNEYRLELSDMLNYATLAVEGGDGIVDMSLKKAANKAASVINMKCRKILNFEPIETPFPEVSKKRK